MNSVEILDGAIECIKRGWTQGSLAEDSDGNCVPPDDDKACSWCISGALIKASSERFSPEWDFLNASTEIVEATSALLRLTRGPSLVMWNDAKGRKKYEVIKKIERARDMEKIRKEFSAS